MKYIQASQVRSKQLCGTVTHWLRQQHLQRPFSNAVALQGRYELFSSIVGR